VETPTSLTIVQACFKRFSGAEFKRASKYFSGVEFKRASKDFSGAEFRRASKYSS
jgi:hypothetical protein